MQVIEVIEAIKKEFIISNSSFVVLVAGCSRCGKSSFSAYLQAELEKKSVPALVLAMDNWVVPLSKRPLKSTVLQRYDLSNIKTNLFRMLRGEKISVEPYDPITRELCAKKITVPPPVGRYVLILEGVLALEDSEINNLANHRIYIECADFLRVKRTIKYYRDVKRLPRDEWRKIIREREAEEIIHVKSAKTKAKYVILW